MGLKRLSHPNKGCTRLVKLWRQRAAEESPLLSVGCLSRIGFDSIMGLTPIWKIKNIAPECKPESLQAVAKLEQNWGVCNWPCRYIRIFLEVHIWWNFNQIYWMQTPHNLYGGPTYGGSKNTIDTEFFSHLAHRPPKPRCTILCRMSITASITLCLSYMNWSYIPSLICWLSST